MRHSKRQWHIQKLIFLLVLVVYGTTNAVEFDTNVFARKIKFIQVNTDIKMGNPGCYLNSIAKSLINNKIKKWMLDLKFPRFRTLKGIYLFLSKCICKLVFLILFIFIFIFPRRSAVNSVQFSPTNYDGFFEIALFRLDLSNSIFSLSLVRDRSRLFVF